MREGMRARPGLMTGLAFTLGLCVGLFLHLPAVSSPSHAAASSRTYVPQRATQDYANNHTDNNKVIIINNIKIINNYNNGSINYFNNDKDSEKAARANVMVGARGTEALLDGVYWGRLAEDLVPPGWGEEEARAWRTQLQDVRVVGVEEGCGRMQNRRLLFSDGTEACARYRLNMDQVQGEVYAYYLARLLGMRNLPPAVLSMAQPTHERWAGVSDSLLQAEWRSDRALVLTPWVDGLREAYIPRELRAGDDALLPRVDHLLKNRTLVDIRELVQWSDLVVLDYLTANVDRVVNNMYNQQWNALMMDAPTHNLQRRADTGQLVFLDNESGLFHSYRLLDRYAPYHTALLRQTCVFRRRTAQALQRLHDSGETGTLLHQLLEREEPLAKNIPPIPEHNLKILQDRIDDVFQQILKCTRKYR